ncbi:MAG: hypothetical protein KBT03_11110 [Bacteroidales bacterium]|nr:hypothetical protein [Candidatus Scybalousia scybalohippi]
MSGRNDAVLKKGRQKAIATIREQLVNIGFEYAKYALIQAVSDWNESTGGAHDLTGNTRNGFVAAVYWDGKLASGSLPNPMSAREIVPGVKGVTSPMTWPGKTNVTKYSDGSHIEVVSNYKASSGFTFVSPEGVGKYARTLSLQFVNAGTPVRTHGLCVLVANSTPYGEYLLQIRGLDILETQSNRSVIDENIKAAVSQFANYLEGKK